MGRPGGPARSRQRSRELLLQALYQWQLAGGGERELLVEFEAKPEFASCDRSYFRQLLGVVLNESEALDEVIATLAVRAVEQLDAVGRAVLLLALAELKHRPDVPKRVVINEAVELAKRYGAADSYRFVNAVLDKAAGTFARGGEQTAR